jgi:drug/metabolite transporter (DMT)-like permease
LGVAVLFGGAVGPALLVAGLARTSAASSSLLLDFELVATLVVARVVFREHLGPRLAAAAALVLAAGALLVWSPSASIDLGGLLVIAACVAWGIDNSATARIDQLSPSQITLAKGAVAGTTNLVIGLVGGGGWVVDWRQIAAALAIGALGYGASITLWVQGARDLGAARGQVIFAAAPFVGAILSWTLLGEPLVAAQLAALPLVLAGVVLSLRTAHEHVHAHEVIEHEHEHVHDDGHHRHEHGDGPAEAARHSHRHRHDPVRHAHAHVPDLHHRHSH